MGDQALLPGWYTVGVTTAGFLGLVLMQLTRGCVHSSISAVELLRSSSVVAAWETLCVSQVTFGVQLRQRFEFAVVGEVMLDSTASASMLLVLVTKVVEGCRFLLWYLGCFWKTHHLYPSVAI